MNNKNSDQKIVRKKYSPQFKDQALDRAVKDGIPQVAIDLGIKESMLYYWRSQQRQGGDSIENQKLQQAEVARLAEENCFLKKAAYFAKESKCETRVDIKHIHAILPMWELITFVGESWVFQLELTNLFIMRQKK